MWDISWEIMDEQTSRMFDYAKRENSRLVLTDSAVWGFLTAVQQSTGYHLFTDHRKNRWLTYPEVPRQPEGDVLSSFAPKIKKSVQKINDIF